MSHSLTQLNINHSRNVDIDILRGLVSDGESEVENLEEQIEELEVEIEVDFTKVAELEKTKAEWKADIDHLQDVITDLENYGADNLISDLDSYIKDLTKELYETDKLPTLISNNIDWDGIVNDCRNDYSEITIDGKEYYYH